MFSYNFLICTENEKEENLRVVQLDTLKRSIHRAHIKQLICHGGPAAQTFTPTQYMYCVLANSTRTTGPHIARVINHIPEWMFPPSSEKVQQCEVPITILYPAISITVSQVEEWQRANCLTPPLLSFNPSAKDEVLICSRSGEVTQQFFV